MYIHMYNHIVTTVMIRMWLSDALHAWVYLYNNAGHNTIPLHAKGGVCEYLHTHLALLTPLSSAPASKPVYTCFKGPEVSKSRPDHILMFCLCEKKVCKCSST